MDPDVADQPHRPKPRSSCFYTTLFLAVLPLWSVVPLSWAFVVGSLYSGRIWRYGPVGLTFFALALAEVFFSVYHWNLASHIGGLLPRAPADAQEMDAAITRLLKTGLAALPEDGGDHESLFVERPGSPEEDIIQLEFDDPRAVDFRHSLRTWFKKAPWSSIRQNDLRKWLYWSLFNAEMGHYDQLPEAHRQSLDRALGLLQMRLGTKVPEGSSSNVEPMRLTIDPIQIMARPLIFYLLIKVINTTLIKYYDSKWDARLGHHNDIDYLLRIPPGWDYVSSPRPLVFVHGLGMGILQYHLLLSHMFETVTDRPILVLLQPHISQDIFHPRFLTPMNRHQMAQSLHSLLQSLGWTHAEYVDEDTPCDEEREVRSLVEGRKGITMISHSNGSYTHAWMLKEHPRLVTRSCFVDPVTFCSWEGDVCYNFIYRPPTTGMELLMKYFVATELGVANLLQRHFDWVANSLWYEEIPNARDPSKTLFVLGGKDEIVHTERVRRYLRSHGVSKNLRLDPNARHGDALMTGSPGHSEILRWLTEYA